MFAILFLSQLFDQLRKERPDFKRQLQVVCGDMMLPNLGLSESDQTMLQQNIHIVFHSGATVRFREPLKRAIEMNVVGVQKMLELCRSFIHLEVNWFVILITV